MHFISSAFAQTTQTVATQSPLVAGQGLGGFIQIILICLVFYFVLVRPHSKKMKEHQNMQGNIRRGDRIITGGGIIAQVIKVLGDHELLVEIADGVRIKILRDSVGDVMGKVKPEDSTNTEDDNYEDENEEDEGNANEFKEALKKSRPTSEAKSKSTSKKPSK